MAYWQMRPKFGASRNSSIGAMVELSSSILSPQRAETGCLLAANYLDGRLDGPLSFSGSGN
jgi:hypothetical protein